MSNKEMQAMFKAARYADWVQVSLNTVEPGASPCFHLEDGCFCLRANRWLGHDDAHASGPGHRFVSLEMLLRSVASSKPQERL